MTVRIRVGSFFPGQVLGSDRVSAERTLARISAAGLDHVGTADHVSFHDGSGIDGIVDATALAMLHESLPVYIAVYLLALRHPVTVARQLASLAERAPGRLIFGVGVGGEDPHESAVCGVDPRTRGRRLDEHLRVLRGLLAGETVDFDGEFVSVETASIKPVPVPPIPIVVGGRAPAALRRAGRLADGWLGIFSTPGRFAERLAEVHAAAAEAGRAEECAQHGMQLWCGFGPQARAVVDGAVEAAYRLPAERFRRFTPAGSPEEVAASLQQYVDAGCRSFNVAPQAGRWEEAVDGLGEVRRLLLDWNAGDDLNRPGAESAPNTAPASIGAAASRPHSGATPRR